MKKHTVSQKLNRLILSLQVIAIILGGSLTEGRAQEVDKANEAGSNGSAPIIFTGKRPGDYFGQSVASAGDLNGDGFADIIVGSSGYNADSLYSGRAYIFWGGPGMDTIADLILAGEAAGDGFGYSVACAGDVNNDGYSDVIVGASGSDANGGDAGRAYLYFGGASMDSIADVIFTGEATRDFFGEVAGAGDVNGDGFSDVIVGAIYNDAGNGDAGRAYIYFGGASMDSVADVIFTATGSHDYFGGSVAGANDVNGDGFSDVIVGAVQPGPIPAPGYALVYFGGTSMDNIVDVTLTGEVNGNRFGRSVAGAGDVNGDGYGDIVVGSIFNSAGGEFAGRVYLFLGGINMDNNADVRFTGLASTSGFPGDYFGNSVDGADINNDGFGDVVIGAFGNDIDGRDAGRAYIFWGDQAMDAYVDVILNDGKTGDDFGNAVANAGDVNGDGYGDIIVGSRYNDIGAHDGGAAFLYLDLFDDITCPGSGDVNNDQTLTPGDALCAFKIYLNNGILPSDCNLPNFECELSAANVNCDSVITPGDALAIYQRFLQGQPPLHCFAK